MRCSKDQLDLLPSRLDNSFDYGADASVYSFNTPDRVGHGYRQFSHIGMCVARMLGILYYYYIFFLNYLFFLCTLGSKDPEGKNKVKNGFWS